ncbi:MAG: class I SAM-dependent methyltransferase [Candidatus Bipolaricaulota bacterium]|nr:class I SAM-dependent methyltransferase [Candidatus Bipolaricaulota bacterium]
MDDRDVGRLWNENAEVWTRLARAGYDVYRDRLNTPAFLAMLPDVASLHGLDVGCGEGHNTRLIAKRGARITAIDIAEVFIGHAREKEEREPLGIDYRVASGLDLPFPDGSFDFVTAVMCLMDMPNVERAVAEAYRVLKPGGFFQFSIMHPCYDTPHRKNLRDPEGRTYAYEVGGYFEKLEGKVEEWTFSAAPEEVRESVATFRVPRFTRTLSQWLNLLIETGFRIERVEEPCPSEAVVEQCPQVQDAQVVPYFLHVRVHKAAAVRDNSFGGTPECRG